MLLGLCIVALFGQVIGQYAECGSPLVRYVEYQGEQVGLITVDSQSRSYTITVKLYSRWSNAVGPKQGSVRVVQDDSRTLTFLVQLPSQNPISQIRQIIFNDHVLCETSVPREGLTSTLTFGSTRQSFYPRGGNNIPDIFDTAESNIDNNFIYSKPPNGGFPRPIVPTYSGEEDYNQPQQRPTYPTRNPRPQGQVRPPSRRPTATTTTTTKPPATTNTNEAECGVATKPQHLVFGGLETERGDWPWVAALIIKDTMNFLCGSTVISPNHVITAAHCMFDQSSKNQLDPSTIIVGVGKYNVSNPYERNVQSSDIRRVTIHEGYNRTTKENDITVILLKEAVKYSLYIRPICLWPAQGDQVVTGSNATVVGWGRTEKDPTVPSDTPMMVKVPIVSNEMCTESHLTLRTNFNPDTELCAGAKNGKGPCHGDSGGGLTLQLDLGDGSHSRWYLRGIVSYSVKGKQSVCNLDNYSVYTDTAKYTSWITNAMRMS